MRAKTRMIREKRRERMPGMKMTLIRKPPKDSEGVLGNPGDGYTHPFILPKIWTVNDFMSTMSAKFFNTLRDCY